jgi:hypothetical protein
MVQRRISLPFLYFSATAKGGRGVMDITGFSASRSYFFFFPGNGFYGMIAIRSTEYRFEGELTYEKNIA